MFGLRSRGVRAALAAFLLGGAAATASAQDLTPSFMSMPPPTQTAAVPVPNPSPAPAQADPQPGQATPPPAQANEQPAPGQPPVAQKLSNGQIDQLVAPIALYPDPILSQLLMASTYPLEVVEASRWVREPANKSLTGDALTAALKNQNWDPSVMALVPFPRVLAIMADQVRWTEQLGNAFLAQQGDVMASVQRLRHAALAAGNLNATPQCRCTIQTSGDQISILPAEPKAVSIPIYNPKFVYGGWPEPAYPPYVFPLPVGFAYDPGVWIEFGPPIELVAFGPLWGWDWFDWPGGRIVIDNAGFGRLDPRHPAFAGGTWVHDPAHRRGVAYAGAAVAARFGAAQAPANVAVTRGGTVGVGRAGAPVAAGRFGALQPAQALGAPRGFVGRGVSHAGSFNRGAAPQIVRGHTAPAHFTPGGGPHLGGFAHGPGGAPHVASVAHGPGGGPHGGIGGAPHGGGGGHHH